MITFVAGQPVFKRLVKEDQYRDIQFASTVYGHVPQHIDWVLEMANRQAQIERTQMERVDLPDVPSPVEALAALKDYHARNYPRTIDRLLVAASARLAANEQCSSS